MLSTSATISNAAALGAGSLTPSLVHTTTHSATATVQLSTKDEYYADIDFDATDDALKQELHDLINPHTVISYDGVWDAFTDVDHYLPTYPCDGNSTNIPDIYSDFCWAKSKQCGNYKQEGDCYNREHLWPKSWFGGFDAGKNAETDLFELWPSDGYVNGLRGNLPLGKVIASTVTCKFFSHRWICFQSG
jgi:endonuclease I